MKYSIMTLTYNQLDYLKDNLKPALDRQTYKDFEWIIASDGSTDGTVEWAKDNHIKIVHKEKNEGFGITEMLNKAAGISEGENLVWIFGDSYPKDDFMEVFDKCMKPDRMLCGIRVNVDKSGKFLSDDWRIRYIPYYDPEAVELQLYHNLSWKSMTLNSMGMSRKAWDEMGGIYPEYKGYGLMDWDMAAWASYHGYYLFLSPKAIIYHVDHVRKEDVPHNKEVFERRLAEFKA